MLERRGERDLHLIGDVEWGALSGAELLEEEIGLLFHNWFKLFDVLLGKCLNIKLIKDHRWLYIKEVNQI